MDPVVRDRNAGADRPIGDERMVFFYGMAVSERT
jgi:hypothetical protein